MYNLKPQPQSCFLKKKRKYSPIKKSKKEEKEIYSIVNFPHANTIPHKYMLPLYLIPPQALLRSQCRSRLAER